VSGRGKAVIVGTGLNTELGEIAHEIKTIEEEVTPLQKKLKELGKWLTIIVLGICTLIFGLGLWRGFELVDMFLMSVSLAVAAIPEGLPAVVTITLALALKKMLKKKALIRKLKSVETLGSVTVICSDKTGTLTKNEMTVTRIFSGLREYTVTGSGYDIKGNILFKGKKVGKILSDLFVVATTCNNSTLEVGDPTERALKVLAEKVKVKSVKRIDEIPFTSDRKYMVVEGDNGVKYLKGALEVVLKKCSKISVSGKTRKITAKDKKLIMKKNAEFSRNALRVLALASGKKDYVFHGIVGMIDPPREEVPDAIKLCKMAGIRSIMITGDHKLTAEAVAKEVGIFGKSMEGVELEELTEKQLRNVVKKTSIFARVNSLHKSRILKALQANGEVVAMTGDGVNDAPALKQADVGVAMNIKGTEISRDVSDLILLDDNFSSIVAAVEEGRSIYNNIRKFVKFLLAANFGEIILITGPILAGLPLPLLASQLLWVNLVTDGFPALALGADPNDPKAMSKKPRNPRKGFFEGMKSFMLFATVLSAIITIGIFLWYFQHDTLTKARTMTFTALIFFELFLVFACRSDTSSLFSLKRNWWLIGAVLLSAGLHLMILYVPFFAGLFHVEPLLLKDWLLLLPLCSVGLILFELKKLVFNKQAL